MFILYAVIIGGIIGYLRGGRMKWLMHRPLSRPGLAIGAFLIQIVLFSQIPLFQTIPHIITACLHLLSYGCLMIFIFFNKNLAGIPILGTGIFSNALAISLNSGYMPTYLHNLEHTSMAKYSELIAKGQPFNNSMIITSKTKLPWLCDVFCLPKWLPLSNVFSAGDTLIAIGICLFLAANMKPPKNTVNC
jgi:hypothetical protein